MTNFEKMDAKIQESNFIEEVSDAMLEAASMEPERMFEAAKEEYKKKTEGKPFQCEEAIWDAFHAKQECM